MSGTRGSTTTSRRLPNPACHNSVANSGSAVYTTHIRSAPHSARIRVTLQLENLMKKILFVLLLSIMARPLLAQGAPSQGAPDQPYTVEYYYKVQWGHQQEFLQLFLKNHYPLLQKIVESGRMISVKIEQPANHMTEDSRWDYRVTIRFKNSTLATSSNPDEDRLIRQLWPDQDTYKREEQRRFEVLLAHWDLPVTDVTPARR